MPYRRFPVTYNESPFQGHGTTVHYHSMLSYDDVKFQFDTSSPGNFRPDPHTHETGRKSSHG